MPTRQETKEEIKKSLSELIDSAKYLGNDILSDALSVAFNAVDFRVDRHARLMATGGAKIVANQMQKEFDRIEKLEHL